MFFSSGVGDVTDTMLYVMTFTELKFNLEE